MKKFEIDCEFLDNFESLHTRKYYQIDLLQFIDFITQKHPTVECFSRVERTHIIDYKNHLRECEGKNGHSFAPKTISRKLAALSSYFDYFIEKGALTKSNPTSSVKRPRKETRSPTHAIKAEMVELLFSAFESEGEHRHLHKAIIITLFSTGLRKSELISLKRCHLKKIDTHWILEYRGKGGKLRQKVVHPVALEALDDYLEWMKSKGREHHPHDWLFQPSMNRHDKNNLDKPLNPRTLNRILDKYGKKIGVSGKFSPHSARATFITRLLEQGVEISRVAQEVSHSSIMTTQVYDKRRMGLEDSPIHQLNYKKEA